MKKDNIASALKVTLAYLFIGGLWVLLTYKLLYLLFPDPVERATAQIIRDCLFLAATALALYSAIKNSKSAQKIVENTLQDKETQYRVLVEKLPAVVFMDAFENTQSTHYISPRLNDLLGYTPEEWANDDSLWENLLHPEDKERVLAEDIRTNQTGEPFRIEYRLRHRDGHYVWIKEDASIVRREDGTPQFWQGILVDITEQKRALESSQRRDAILKSMGDAAEKFLQSADWEENIGQVLEALGQATKVSRVYIFKKERVENGAAVVSQVYEWCNKGIEPQIDNENLQNLNLMETGYARWAEIFDKGQILYGNTSSFPLEEQPMLIEQDIRSLICIPIQAVNDWWGFIGFDGCKVERESDSMEIEALRAAAGTLGAAIQRKLTEEALRNSEMSYRGLFNTASDAIYIQDKNGYFLDVNDGAVQIYGYPREFFIGKNPEFLSAPGKNDLKKTFQALQDAFNGKPQQFEFWGKRSNGEIFPKDVRLFKGSYFGEEVVIAVAQDITARKQAEDALQKQLRELSVLHSAALAESTSTDMDTLIRQITDIISDTLYSDNCGVLLLNETGDMLIPHYSYRGIEAENIGEYLPVAKGVSGKVISSRRSIRIDDVSLESVYYQIAGSTRSELCVPIISRSKIIGVLNVESRKLNAFTERDERLLNTIAGGLANAIERIQLFKLEKKRRQQADNLREATLELTSFFDPDRLYETIFTSLAKLVEYDSASIEIINQGTSEIAAGKNIPKELVGKKYPFNSEKWDGVPLRQPIIIPDVQSDERFVKFDKTDYIRSWMGIPLFTRDKVIGFLNLDSRIPGFFNDEHASIAQTFANQAAIAIENARLFNLERKRRETAETVRQATAALTNLLDLPSLQNSILEWMYKITPYDSASVLEIEGDRVRITATRGLPNPGKALNQTFPLSNALCKIINATGKPLVLDDCKNDPRFEKWGDSEHVRGWMGVPLISRGQVIGYITVDSKTPNAFTQNDVIAAQTFAQQAAASLENVRLYTETRQRLEELEMVSRVSYALRAARDTQEMLPILMNEINAIIGTEAATISLYDHEIGALRPYATTGLLSNLPKSAFKPGEGVIGKVYVSGVPHVSPEFVNDPLAQPENAKFFGKGWGGIAVPIRTASETIGVIIVGIQQPRRIEPHYVRLITTIAEIAGNAIHRSNLYERSEEQIRRLTTLREMDTAITSSLDLHITLNIITEHLITKMGVSAATILVFNPDSQMLDYYAANGFQNREIGRASLSIGDGLAGQILLNRRAVYIKDMNNESGANRSGLFSGETFTSYYAMPLFSKGVTKGILETYFKQAFTPTADWLDFLQTLAGQATIAIDNAQLFESLQRTNQDISLAYDTTLEGWGKALELRDKETQGHTQRVTNLTLELARQMGIPETELIHIRRGALLHDIGKMGVPDSILRKPGPLTADEMTEMKNHPQYAFDLLAPILYLRPSLDIPYCHHEWWDGNGYPQGLKGEEIPLSARIFAVIDVWDALLSDRPYRDAWNEKEVLKYIADLSGKQFDPRVVAVFQKTLETETRFIRSNYPPNTASRVKKKPGTKKGAQAKRKKMQ